MKTCASLIDAHGVMGQLIQANTDGTWTVYEAGDDLPPGVFGQASVSNATDEVTMRQARLALHALGKLELVDAAIDALPEPPRVAARITWDHSQTVQRSNPMLALLAPALGLSDADLDAIFEAAARL